MRVEGATTWLVLLDKTSNTDEALARLRQVLDPKAFELREHALADFYNKTVALFSRQVLVVNVLIGLIIVLSITGTPCRWR